MDHIDELRAREQADPELVVAEDARRVQMQLEARQRIDDLAEARRRARLKKREDDDDFDDDDFDVEVVYAE